MISRHLTDTLRERLDQFPAVVLLGPRQVGKTTLAQHIGIPGESIYLDLEAPSDLNKLDDPEYYLSSHADKLIILDEVQRVPALFQTLRGLIDKGRRHGKRAGRFLLLGSASMDLLQQSGESLAGRIAYLELNPFDVTETAPEDMERLWIRGGFPDSFLANSDKASTLWRENFIRTYLERDIPQLGPRIPAATLRRFWTMLCHNQAGLLNAAQLARGLSVDGKTVTRYLDLLVDLLLVRRLPPYTVNAGKRLVKSPKIYVRDSGLAHTLLTLGDREAVLSHPIAGNSWEGFVIENILSIASDRVEASFYRTSAGAEIDLLLKLPTNELWAIEIKKGLSPKLQRGFYHAREDLNPTRCFIVYSGTEPYKKQDGVEVVGLRTLCQELQARLA